MHFERCLAQELIEMIMDFLHDDKRALSHCSLVCTSFTRAARYHLLGSYRLEVRHDRGGYAGQLKKPSQEPLRSHLRELTLAAGPIHALSPELTEDVVVSVFKTLPRLRSLKLRQTGYVASSLPPRDHRLELNTLSISWMYPSIPGSSDSLLSLLALFHTVRVLDLDVIHHKHLPTPKMLQRQSAPSLRVHCLQLRDVSLPLLAAIRVTVYPDYLQTVRASVTAADDIHQLGFFFRAMGHGLQHLQLSFWNFWSSDRVDWSVLQRQLSRCTSLQSVIVLYANSGPFFTWDALFSILQAIPATVKDVTLVIREVCCLDTVDWSRMAKQLERFTCLQNLRFELCTADTFRSRQIDEKTRQRIWEALPEFKARAILW